MMSRHGIRAIMAPPRRVRTTDSRHGLPIAPNLIARDFTAPNRVWLADITYIPTAEGWLYRKHPAKTAPGLLVACKVSGRLIDPDVEPAPIPGQELI